MSIREDIKGYVQWWKGDPNACAYLEHTRNSESELEARKAALGIKPEQLVTVRWRNYWEGLNK